jgi:hypothetical protein
MEAIIDPTYEDVVTRELTGRAPSSWQDIFSMERASSTP